MSGPCTNAIRPFLPGKVACAGNERTMLSNPATKTIHVCCLREFITVLLNLEIEAVDLSFKSRRSASICQKRRLRSAIHQQPPASVVSGQFYGVSRKP